MTGQLRLCGFLAAVLAAGAVLSLMIGPAPLGVSQVLGGLVDRQGGPIATIVQEIRLPRTLLAILVGASLGLAGAALQGFLRNPLAEPGVIGISATAALGAVIVFYTGIAAGFILALPLGGMAGALLAVMVLRLLGGRSGDPLTLVLAGVALSAFSGALTALALNLAPSPYAALEALYWMLGSLADRSFVHVGLAALLMAPGWLLLAASGRALDALALGEEAAGSLGFDVRRVQTRIVLGTALAVGAAVAVSGAIGFVGLVVPHLLRPWVAYRPGRLLLPSALGGAILLLVADMGVRLLPTTSELRIGVVTAIIGAPFFLALIVESRRAPA